MRLLRTDLWPRALAAHGGRRWAFRAKEPGASLAVALTLALTIVLSGCGGAGGVDSGGTGMTPETVAVGPVQGFGSIIVGGVHYDESGAAITDEDGQPVPAGTLALGTMTVIEGSAVRANGARLESTARSVRVIEQVVGPVQAVDPAAGRLTVLGQRVDLTPDTAFDATVAAGLGALAPGDVVAVYGQLDPAAGRIVATRLERRLGATAFVLRGAVDRYDRAARTLGLAGVAIDLAAVPSEQLPDRLDAGRLVRVRLVPGSGTGPWTATSLRRVGLMLQEGANVEIEGRVTAYTSAQRFSVDGIEVDAAAASFPKGSAGLALGARVEVEGRAVAGMIVARSVELESDDGSDTKSIEIEGRITAVDPTAQTFVVREVTVAYSAATRFEGGTAADLVRDRKVSVKGRLAADRTRVDATSISIER